MEKVVVITGPTATGKTALGVRLAQLLNGEVVSADSMQIYKYMNIGTAKPTQEEMQGVPHHMIDVVSPFDNYSVALYVEQATAAVEDILSRGKLPIIVGGTGLYIESLVAGRIFAPNETGNLRGELEEHYDTVGGSAMLRELALFDIEGAKRLHENDKKRIVRAFEIYRLTGQTISEHNEQSKSVPPRYDALRLALDYSDREKLYDRINSRVDEMMDAGLLGEASILLKMGLTTKFSAMQAIGYKELMEAAVGEVGLAQAVELVKKRSRRYAKRQLTWLRRREDVKWLIWENSPDLEWGTHISTKYLTEAGYI